MAEMRQQVREKENIPSPGAKYIADLKARAQEIYGNKDVPGIFRDEALITTAIERSKKGWAKLPDLKEPNRETLRDDLQLASYYLSHLNRERGIVSILYNANGEQLDGSKYVLAQASIYTGGSDVQVMAYVQNEVGRPITARLEKVPGRTDGRTGWVLSEDVRLYTAESGLDLLKKEESKE